MKFFKRRPGVIALGLMLLTVSALVAGDRIVRYTYQGGGQTSTRLDLRSDALVVPVATKRGDAVTSPTLPTTSNADNFGAKIPFYNGSGASTARGTIIIASATTTTPFYGSFAAVLATTTVLGICDGVYTNGSIGWMTTEGYALVLTTGTVNVGNVIVTTDTVAGYGGAVTTVTSGTDVCVAVGPGTAAGGLTPCRLR